MINYEINKKLHRIFTM